MDEYTLLHMLHSLVNSTNTYVLSYDECVDFFQRYEKEHRTYIIFNNEVRKNPVNIGWHCTYTTMVVWSILIVMEIPLEAFKVNIEHYLIH